MSSTDETKPAAKGRRSKKGEARRQKSNSTESPVPVEMQTPQPKQEPVPEADLQPVVSEPLEAVVAEAMVADEVDAIPADAALPADAPSSAEPAPTEHATAEPSPVSLQTIAKAYRDYTRKSFEEFGSFFEQLTGARSLDKAMEVQTEFVKRAYENSVAESQKIRELHRKLARQTLEPFGGIAGKTPETHGKS
jgi:Phasin protein